ncbi:MAG: hypothetical protein GQ534_12070 [Candidatus Delongbacteria bacterium]|nr:hypothetical protein [Candidatus Delongbacteria bacterium]
MLNSDYKEMLLILSEEKVKFLIVGAFALGSYGYPRATGDIDIWVEASSENAKKIIKSLAKFGAPMSDIKAEDFEKQGIIYQIGVVPRRIDIITEIDGVDFDIAYLNKKIVNIQDISVPILSYDDLIKNKESTGREKDVLDVKMLKKLKK